VNTHDRVVGEERELMVCVLVSTLGLDGACLNDWKSKYS